MSENFFMWFDNNAIKANDDNCHLLLSDAEIVNAQIGNSMIESSTHRRPLGVTIDKTGPTILGGPGGGGGARAPPLFF